MLPDPRTTEAPLAHHGTPRERDPVAREPGLSLALGPGVPRCTPSSFRTAVCALLLGCASPGTPIEPEDPVEAAEAYIGDAFARRAALEASVAVADTPYAELRLAHYSLSGAGIDDPWLDWDLAPVVTLGPVRRLRVRAAPGDPAPEPFEPEPFIDDVRDLEELDDYVGAGRIAFELCPIQVHPRYQRLSDSAEEARSFGLHVTDEGEVRGVVELLASDGEWVVAITCAACHSSTAPDGTHQPGLSNPDWHIAGLLGIPGWRPGTMDVTADGVWNPVRAADLRPLALQERMHHTGNLANGRIARMIRIETLLGNSYDFEKRPSRRVVAAMALYIESLAEELPEPDWGSEGARAFGRSCASCHRGSAMAGPPVTVRAVGTDPAATIDSARGTGGYRTPSLRGVGARRRILHDGSATDLRGLLRLEASDHVGHPYGTELPRETREAIAEFLGCADGRCGP